MDIDLSDFLPFGSSSAEKSGEGWVRTATKARRLAPGKRPKTGKATDRLTAKKTVRIALDLPAAMLASLEAKAGSESVGDLIRAVLVAAGHSGEADVTGVRSDNHVTDAERREPLGVTSQS